ncbi:MAG: Kelch repeat-containing protein [Thermoplasmatota archaeon]
MSLRRRSALSLLTVTLLVSVSFLAAADTVTTMGAQLPTGRYYLAAASDGEHIYAFGGNEHGTGTNLRHILRYDPATDHLSPMGAQLEAGRTRVTTVWADNEEVFYLIGGRQTPAESSTTSQISRFDPETDTLTVVDQMPVQHRSAAAVWHDGCAYIFGGGGPGFGATDDIYHYCPGSGVTILAASLPGYSKEHAAFKIGDYAYIVGGSGASPKDSIIRFDLNTHAITTMGAKLPTESRLLMATTNGHCGYIFGGTSNLAENGRQDWIARYDPTTDQLFTSSETLPSARFAAGAAFLDGASYVLGGWTDSQSREIVRIEQDSCIVDTDEDGLSDSDEAALGTDPNDPDTDDDGWLDGAEVDCSKDPLDGASTPTDFDSDGICDALDDDNDNDGLTDEEELALGTDPHDPDTDDDDLNDRREGVFGTDPLDPDTDDDCYLDGREVRAGSDPTRTASFPLFGIPVELLVNNGYSRDLVCMWQGLNG